MPAVSLNISLNRLSKPFAIFHDTGSELRWQHSSCTTNETPGTQPSVADVTGKLPMLDAADFVLAHMRPNSADRNYGATSLHAANMASLSSSALLTSGTAALVGTALAACRAEYAPLDRLA